MDPEKEIAIKNIIPEDQSANNRSISSFPYHRIEIIKYRIRDPAFISPCSSEEKKIPHLYNNSCAIGSNNFKDMSNTSFSCHDAQELPPSSKKMLFPSEIGHDDKLVECHSYDCYKYDTKSQISHLTYHIEGYDSRTNDNNKIFHSSKNIGTNQLDNADE